MKKVLLSSLVALMAITSANAAGVSGIASTDYVNEAIGNIEIPDLKGDEKTIKVENETIKAITETGEIGTNATSLVTSGAVKTALDNKADKATTLSGYGITDAYTQTETDGLLGNKADKTAVDALTTDAVRVDKDKNMIVENNTDYGDCAVGDTCTLVAVRTASGMQSVWKKIFPATAQ